MLSQFAPLTIAAMMNFYQVSVPPFKNPPHV